MVEGLLVKDEKGVSFKVGQDLLVDVLHLGCCLLSGFDE